MMPTVERHYVQVPAHRGEEARRALLNAGGLDNSCKIVKTDSALRLPLVRDFDRREIATILGEEGFDMGVGEFVKKPTKPTVQDLLRGVMDDEEIQLLPRAFDSIGDIAVLEIPDALSKYERQIGEAFLTVHSRFSTVLAKASAISGTKRVREYRHVAGVCKTRTVHREYGCRLVVDLAKAYFSPRLLEEHHRVATQVQPGETVLDMFTGVGPFAIHIASRQRAYVIAVDINPDAIDLLRQSMALNRLRGTIEPVVADAHAYCGLMTPHSVDRVIMNHPTGAADFVHDACRVLREGGVMHYYDFAAEPDPEERVLGRLRERVGQCRRRTETLATRRVRNSAPHEYQVAVDIRIL